MGVGTALLAGAIIGGATSAYSAHQQSKAAKKQAEIQREADEKQARIAAGKAGAETQQNAIQFDSSEKKSALQRAILTRSNSGSKLGD